MTRRSKALERLRGLDAVRHLLDDYVRGYLDAVRNNSSHLNSDSLTATIVFIERHMHERGVKC